MTHFATHGRARLNPPRRAADSQSMESIVTWIGTGMAGLLFVAIVVAWWEHLGRNEQRAAAENPSAPPARAVAVDIELDALAAGDAGGAGGASEAGERQQAPGGALMRMAAPALGRSKRWLDTRPTVLKGAPEKNASPSIV